MSNNNNNNNDGRIYDFHTVPAKLIDESFRVIEVPIDPSQYVYDDGGTGHVFRLLPGIEKAMLGPNPVRREIVERREKFIADVRKALDKIGLYQLQDPISSEEGVDDSDRPYLIIWLNLQRNREFQVPSEYNRQTPGNGPIKGLEIPLMIVFHFGYYTMPEGNEEHRWGDYFGSHITLFHFKQEKMPKVLHALDDVIFKYYNPIPSYNNIRKATIKKEWTKKVLGDPYFANYVMSFIPRENKQPHGGRRKTLKRKSKRRATRKN